MNKRIEERIQKHGKKQTSLTEFFLLEIDDQYSRKEKLCGKTNGGQHHSENLLIQTITITQSLGLSFFVLTFLEL